MRTIADVRWYCECRTGVKLVEGLFVPTSGGLYALEQSATHTGHHTLAYEYRQQRLELQHLMYELGEGD